MTTRGKYAPRKSRRCPSCGHPAILYGGACGPCRADIPLTGGYWRPRPGSGGVQEWVSDAVVMSRAEWKQLELDLEVAS